MEKIILFGIGIAAVWYVARMFLKEVKGEAQCHCAQGSCSSKKSCNKE